MFNDNVFHLNMKGVLPVFKSLDDDADFIKNPLFIKIRDEMSHRLLTVCTVYDESPNI